MFCVRAARALLFACAALLAVLVLPKAAEARAPDTFEEMYAKPTVIESPQWYALELKLGPYKPAAGGSAFSDTFGKDRGWLLGLELDFVLYHIPYVGTINAGAGWGWANYDAKALLAGDSGGRSGETTEFTIYPMSALAVLRIDTLARQLNVPLLLTGKIGYDFVRWIAETGSRTDGDGLNKGLRWAAQAGLELDFFDRSSARALDEEFGINHTFLFFEYFESKTKGTGDRSFSIGFGALF
jgi:hypothetical protein